MNGSEEPVEIEVEPEIQNILPFEDFDIDHFVDYLENDIGNGHRSEALSHLGNNKHQHVNNSNHKPSSYQCTVCREVLGSGSELLKHVRTHTRLFGSQQHRDSKNFKLSKCCICMQSFDHPTKLKIHEETQHLPPFRCRYCNSYHTALKYYKAHLKLHQRSSSRVPEQSSSMSLHHKQNNNHHKQSKKSGFKHFYTPPKLTTATAANLASLAIQTNLSNQGLPLSSPSPLRCKYCGKLFAKFTTLRKHEMLHQLNGNTIVKSAKINHENDNKSAHASVPASIAAAAAVANKSTALTLTPSLLSNLNKLANLKSSECSDGKTKPAILININTNNDKPQAESAKKSQEMPLNSSSGLMISSVSSVDKNYQELIEKQREASTAATVFIQNGKKAVSLADLQCPICKKIVSQPFSLKVHLRTHTMEKPYSCPVCNKNFSQSCNLKTHMNIHNKQQYHQQPPQVPLMCKICNKTFQKASSLNTHMISHTAKLYCYACNINFDDDALTYSQHMQVTHNVIMTKDLISRAKANLQRSASMNHASEIETERVNGDEVHPHEEEPKKLMEVFQVQSSSGANPGQIPKLKITIKKEPMMEQQEGNESDSSSSSSSSSASSSSSSSSGSSSSSTTHNGEKNDNK